jgi:hypothetical protein
MNAENVRQGEWKQNHENNIGNVSSYFREHCDVLEKNCGFIIIKYIRR